jgi:hypothetical protein
MSDAPPLEVDVVGGRTFDWDRMPPGMVEQYDSLNRAGDALYDAGDKAGAKAKWDEALALVEPYEKKPKPLPTAPDPHPPELIPDNSEALAVYTSPDVVKVGDKPTPFAVHGKGSDDHNYSPDVRSNGQVVKHQNSKMTTTYGAEPGDAGVKSGTEGKAVEPTSSSPVVKVNGNPVQRHSDTCTLNNGNCPGEYTHVKSTEVNSAPSGSDSQDQTATSDQRGTGEKGWDGFYDNSSEAQAIGAGLKRGREYLGDPSLIGQDARAAYDALPTTDQVVEFGQNIGQGAVEGAKYVWNNPKEAATGALNSGVDGLKGLWGGLTDAYDKGGVAQAGGHLAAAGLSVVNPFKKAKLAGKVAEELDDLGDAAKRYRRHRDHEKKEGKDGARSTRLHKVKCFEVPERLKGKEAEYARQLKEQTDYINNKMTADDMAYAHWVLEKAGGTDALRRPHLQQAHRNAYKAHLREQGKSAAEIDEMTKGTAATHFLDMVAGGDPAVFSTDAAGKPVLGDTGVNSDIGGQWTRQGRAASLREEAERMRRGGEANKRMHVELRPCKPGEKP